MTTLTSFDQPRKPGSVKALKGCNIGMCLFGLVAAGVFFGRFYDHLPWVSNLMIGCLALFFPLIAMRMHAIINAIGELEKGVSVNEKDLRVSITLDKEAVTMVLGVMAAFTVVLLWTAGYAVHRIKELELLYGNCLKALGH